MLEPAPRAAMQQIGDYIVRRLIGEGGMGKVYEAEERLSKRRVALKVLRRDLAGSEDGRRLFLGEMTILAHLDHPNIVRCLACTEAHGDLVMALEYLEGQTLRELLRARGRLHWQEAVRIAIDIAAALFAAHTQPKPIIHRDLKPENIMILPDGRTKVMDFGIAKVLDSVRGHTTHTVGTLQYMSPEQIDATGVDARSDLYSLGLVLYEMLVGTAPFESASPRELLNLQCTQPAPAIPPEVRAMLPPGLEKLIFQLLVKQPGGRPTSADIVGQHLAQIAGLPAQIAQPNPVAQAQAAPPPPLVHRPMIPTPTPGISTHTPGVKSSATIALIQQASSRNRSTPVIIGIVVLLLVAVAGGGTYMAMTASATGDGEDPPKPATPAKAPPKTPDTKTPDTKTPDTKTPDTKTPDTKTPDTKADDDGGGLFQSLGLSGGDDEDKKAEQLQRQQGGF